MLTLFQRLVLSCPNHVATWMCLQQFPRKWEITKKISEFTAQRSPKGIQILHRRTEACAQHGTGDGDREGAPAEEHVDMRDHVLLMRIFGKLRGRLRPAGV